MENIKILENTNEYIVCIKPSGILSEDASGGMPCLLADGNKKPLVVHRLDREVSGAHKIPKTITKASRQGASRGVWGRGLLQRELCGSMVTLYILLTMAVK